MLSNDRLAIGLAVRHSVFVVRHSAMSEKQREEALLVEDEGVVVNLVRRVLKDYVRLTSVDSCEKGLELLHESPGRFAVVLQDMAFPAGKMQGHEALKEIRREWPEQQVIILSIYERDEMAEQGFHFPEIQHVAKGKAMVELLPALVVAAVCRMKARRNPWRPEASVAASRRSTVVDELLSEEEQGPATEPAGDAEVAGEVAAQSSSATVQTLDEVQRSHIIHVLKVAGGNIRGAASLLGIGYHRLLRLIKRLEINLRSLPKT